MAQDEKPTHAATDRRAFLTAAGKFAVVTPPVMTMLLSTSLTSPAIAASGSQGHGNNGNHGNGNNGDNGNHGDGNNGNHYGQLGKD
jgi:hypothetical protein